jgi:hypothetical protein
MAGTVVSGGHGAELHAAVHVVAEDRQVPVEVGNQDLNVLRRPMPGW